MGAEIVSDTSQITGSATALARAAGQFKTGGVPDRGSSTGPGYDKMVATAERTHKLIGRISGALEAEANACKDMAATFEQVDQAIASQGSR